MGPWVLINARWCDIAKDTNILGRFAGELRGCGLAAEPVNDFETLTVSIY